MITKKNANPSLNHEVEKIQKHFNKKSIIEILNSLKEENSNWSKDQIMVLEKKSPTSLGVTTKQLGLSSSLDLRDCLTMEFRICQAMMSKNDFYEGVRANLVDKDRKPK
jgi:enoyl-CoA hydratase/carnithine racemase